jgi:hypothetical protein
MFRVYYVESAYFIFNIYYNTSATDKHTAQDLHLL